MSMNSNIMGMQGPNLNNPCASPQVPPMHSEAKMVKWKILKYIVYFLILLLHTGYPDSGGCSQTLLTSFLVICYTLFNMLQ